MIKDTALSRDIFENNHDYIKVFCKQCLISKILRLWVNFNGRKIASVNAESFVKKPIKIQLV